MSTFIIKFKIDLSLPCRRQIVEKCLDRLWKTFTVPCQTAQDLLYTEMWKMPHLDFQILVELFWLWATSHLIVLCEYPKKWQRWAGLGIMLVPEHFKEEPGIHTGRSMVIWEKPSQEPSVSLKINPHELQAIWRKQIILSFSRNIVSKVGKIVHNEFFVSGCIMNAFLMSTGLLQVKFEPALCQTQLGFSLKLAARHNHILCSFSPLYLLKG